VSLQPARGTGVANAIVSKQNEISLLISVVSDGWKTRSSRPDFRRIPCLDNIDTRRGIGSSHERWFESANGLMRMIQARAMEGFIEAPRDHPRDSKRVKGWLLLLVACLSCSCSNNHVRICAGSTGAPVANAMVYAWSYRLTRPPVAVIRVSDDRGVADFSGSSVSGRFSSVTVMKEGFFPVRAFNDGAPVRLLPLPADGDISREVVERVNKFYADVPSQGFVDVPARDFRSFDEALDVGYLADGLDDDTSSEVKERWVSAFKGFVKLRF